MAFERPNILLIVTDEERCGIPRPDGFSMPARERLAEQGVAFDNYYVASAMCSSSRSVLYTGRHVPLTEIYDNDNMPYVRALDPDLGTIGTMLGAHGYYCTYQGKWHLSNAYLDPANPRSTVRDLEPYGFYEWNDWGDIDGGAWAGLRIDPVIAGQAVKWLRDRAPVVAAEQPWFMTVNFVNPHDIMSFDYGGVSEVQLPPNLAHAVVTRPPADVPVYRTRWEVDLPASVHDDLSGAPAAVREYAAVTDVAFGPVAGDDRWLAGMSFYLNCLRDVDRSIDLVLDALAASGQADRTVVVCTADHGDLVGSHGLRQKGALVYDENFHVPLVVAHPDVAGGTRTGALASGVDLAPTLLAFAGVEDAVAHAEFPGLSGRSFAPVLEGHDIRRGVLTAVENVTNLDAGFWRHFDDPEVATKIMSGELRPDWTKRGFLRGYTDERYSFGRYFSPLEPNRPKTVDELFAANDVVLYDRLEDPAEMVNLAADPARRHLVAQCSDRLEELISAEIGDDRRAWVTERPQLLGWPTFRGDAVARPA
ncbi:MAG TPA: sulfatase-like hydrolase/transferase [Acidimicrobiales bacterium]|nr:sulfatase-like hydrolase/transferase [Acidimicrobiales bacterium]